MSNDPVILKQGEPVTTLVDLGSAVVRVKRKRYAAVWTTVEFIVPPDCAHDLPAAFATVSFSEDKLAEFLAALTVGQEARSALEQVKP